MSAELRQWHDPQAVQWSAVLQALETEAASRLKAWLPKLHYPIRVGEHYEGGHWLGTFAVYLTSGAGLESLR